MAAILLLYVRILNSEEFDKSMCLLWSIWYERNKRFHGIRPKLVEAVVDWMLHYVVEIKFTKSQSIGTIEPHVTKRRATRRFPPLGEILR